jgi:hypothetical protein
MRFQSYALVFNIQLNLQPTHPLRPVIPNNTSLPRFTAAAGTELAEASYASTVTIILAERALQPKGPSSPTQYCWIRLAPIVQYSPLLPPLGV